MRRPTNSRRSPHWLIALGLAATLVSLAAVDVRADEAEENVSRPFNGKDLAGWRLKEPSERSHWNVGVARADEDDARRLRLAADAPGDAAPQLVNAAGGGVDIYTEQKYGDCTIALEFMVPQGSNSGVYVMGEYEVQIFDSFGKQRVGPGDVGGLYGAAAPRVNAARPPGEWQELVIDFRAPRFQDGEKTEHARFVKVTLNGQVIHENVEMPGPTPSGLTGVESTEGPLLFQGDHGPVAYRKIRIHPH